jgi:hypothetical protein
MHEALEPLVGEWEITVPFADTAGRSIFKWTLDGAFLVQRTEVPVPEAPDSLSLYARDGDGYVQHYFDARGVVRRYRMSLEGGLWRLWRDDPDFAQRWTATVRAETIEGTWEKCMDGRTWEKDFDLTYRRVG